MEILFHGDKVQLSGDPVALGAQLPDFELLSADRKIVKKAELLGKLTLYSVVPDLNTRVCSISTQKFNQEADRYPAANFITISTNAPEDQQNWCALEGVKSVRVLSDEKLSFGKSMNLFIPTNGLDTRAIYLVDAQGVVVYREIIEEISNEPNYEAALTAIQKEINK
ncbi:thiol peroxidase [Xylocopilactobacillus apicola]|uniref:2-Cys peroxiredoxin n=1 Tax=Xylocopilactobacillus apicola TaxID=2932184 RepID=A0AAU9CV95_9LACO|nr:thiol peroxidase [Xylocopilactobacillus apicola]BDR57899.1 2-Cys peroxiredoxin [Xylocopilactobacillus apicola]